MLRMISAPLRFMSAALAAAGTLLSLCGAPFLSVFAWWEAVTSFSSHDLMMQVAAACVAFCLTWFAAHGVGAALMALGLYFMRVVDCIDN